MGESRASSSSAPKGRRAIRRARQPASRRQLALMPAFEPSFLRRFKEACCFMRWPLSPSLSGIRATFRRRKEVGSLGRPSEGGCARAGRRPRRHSSKPFSLRDCLVACHLLRRPSHLFKTLISSPLARPIVLHSTSRHVELDGPHSVERLRGRLALLHAADLPAPGFGLAQRCRARSAGQRSVSTSLRLTLRLEI